MNKKILLWISMIVLSFSLVACNAENQSSTDASDKEFEETQSATTSYENSTKHAEPSTNTEFPLKITDMMNREISIESSPTRVVALSPDVAEILSFIGATQQIVGIGTYVDYPEEILDLPKVETGLQLNAEQILALEPDAIFLSDLGYTEDQIKPFEDAGIPVITMNINSIDEIYKAIEISGKVMGLNTEAHDLITSMKAQFEEISKSVPQDGNTIYFETSPLEYGLWTAGKDTYMQEVAELLHLKNIFQDTSSWSEISEEQVISKNPDYILTISMYFGEGPTPEEEIASRAGWENISAVKSNRILNVSTNELSRPSPRLVEGVRKLADFILENPVSE